MTVALSAQGADELLGGYRKHRAASIASAWRRLPAPLRSVALAAARRGPARLARPVRTLEAGDATTRLLAMTGHVHDDLRPRLVRGPLAELDGLAARHAVEACMNGFPDDPLPATMYLDGQLSLVDDMIHYFDRASMAHSLEVRVPFLDHHVVEYCATIPSSLKVRRLRTKHLLKEAARGLIPDQIIDKKKIGFFNAAVDGWFRTQMRGPLGDYLLDSRPRYGEIVDRGTVAGLVRAHVDGTNTRHADLLLSLLMLEVWLATYLPRATALPVPARERIAVGL